MVEEGKVPIVRSRARPERHFANSFATLRLAIARYVATWLPRCPCCHRLNPMIRPLYPLAPGRLRVGMMRWSGVLC